MQKLPGKWNIVHTGNEEHARISDQYNQKALVLLTVMKSTTNGDAGADLHLERTSQTMWKPSTPSGSTPAPADAQRPTTTPTPTPEFTNTVPKPMSSATAVNDQATIGKSLVIKGEVTGSESLYIDGRVEGSIHLPGNRVTVGRNGVVAANVTAREVVILGKVRGNVSATDRVDIRNEGSLTGDVVAQRISIEDGAFFKGGIDIRKPNASEKPQVVESPDKPSADKSAVRAG